eukprot:TRINITY_DN9246_c0_g1_i1.p1 TRINITY_DN9246_c0_g1~~TRINITY_DN9246_c0_g1_i1.p1  ORF type:complete len:463 (-),score=63.96 TRINITY_DN9246_c0_g1_i1:58-1446(-)
MSDASAESPLNTFSGPTTPSGLIKARLRHQDSIQSGQASISSPYKETFDEQIAAVLSDKLMEAGLEAQSYPSTAVSAAMPPSSAVPPSSPIDGSFPQIRHLGEAVIVSPSRPLTSSQSADSAESPLQFLPRGRQRSPRRKSEATTAVVSPVKGLAIQRAQSATPTARSPVSYSVNLNHSADNIDWAWNPSSPPLSDRSSGANGPRRAVRSALLQQVAYIKKTEQQRHAREAQRDVPADGRSAMRQKLLSGTHYCSHTPSFTIGVRRQHKFVDPAPGLARYMPTPVRAPPVSFAVSRRSDGARDLPPASTKYHPEYEDWHSGPTMPRSARGSLSPSTPDAPSRHMPTPGNGRPMSVSLYNSSPAAMSGSDGPIRRYSGITTSPASFGGSPSREHSLMYQVAPHDASAANAVAHSMTSIGSRRGTMQHTTALPEALSHSVHFAKQALLPGPGSYNLCDCGHTHQ